MFVMDNFKLLFKTNIIATTATTQTAHTPKPRHRNDVKLQRSSPKGILLQKSGTATEQFRETKTKNGLEPFPNISQNWHNNTEERSTHTKASYNGDDNILPLTITTPQIEEVFSRDEITNELYVTVLQCGY